jgi:hypothetical protein
MATWILVSVSLVVLVVGIIALIIKNSTGWITGDQIPGMVIPAEEGNIQLIKSGRFRIGIPKKYKVICHNFHKEQAEFFKNISQYEDGNEEIVNFVRSHPLDLDSLKGFYSYEVKMGNHSFIFHTQIGNEEPEGLAEFIQSQTRSLPVLKDVEFNGVKGKQHGAYSKEMSWIDWWLKKGDCMICLNVQGMGMPADEIKDDVLNILNGLEYIP